MFILLSQLSYAIDCSAVIWTLETREECFAKAKSCYAQTPNTCHVGECKRIEAKCGDLPSEAAVQKKKEQQRSSTSYYKPSYETTEVCGLVQAYNEKTAAYYIFALQMGMMYSGMSKEQVLTASQTMADNAEKIAKIPAQTALMEEMYVISVQLQTALGCN